MVGGMGSPTIWEPPGDVPGKIAGPTVDPQLMTIYGFSVNLWSQQTSNPLGLTVFVAALNVQAAETAVRTKYGSDLCILRGGTPSFVGGRQAPL